MQLFVQKVINKVINNIKQKNRVGTGLTDLHI